MTIRLQIEHTLLHYFKLETFMERLYRFLFKNAKGKRHMNNHKGKGANTLN